MERHPEPAPGTEGDVLGRRVGAMVLDALVYWLVVAVVGGATLAVGSASGLLVAAVVLGLGAFTVSYWWLAEGAYGRRPGKALLGLVVVTEDGEPCTTTASVVRNVMWAVDGLGVPPLVLALVALRTDRSQRLGDLAAETVVVRTRAAAETATEHRPEVREVGQSGAARERGVR